MNTYRVFVIIQTGKDLTPEQAAEAVSTALTFGLHSAGIPDGYIRTASVPARVQLVRDGETELV